MVQAGSREAAMKRPPPHNWLFIFKAVVDAGSITLAAERLSVTQSAVSQQLKSLEEYLGKRLITRSKKGVALTDVGRHYYNVIKVSLDSISNATDQMFGRDRRDTVTVRANYSFVEHWLTRHLHEFHALCPGVSFELYTGFWLSDFDQSSAGVEIRYGEGGWAGYHCHRLSRDTTYPVCSPELAARITSLEDVLTHPLVAIMGNRTGWLEWAHQNGIPLQSCQPALSVENNLLAYELAANGPYVTLALDSLVGDHLASGQLVKVPGGEVASVEDFYVLEPANGTHTPGEAMFIDWLKGKFKAGSGAPESASQPAGIAR